MIVVDASAISLTFADPLGDPRVQAAHAISALGHGMLVPEHWYTEVLSTIRGLWLGGKLDQERADSAVEALSAMTVAVAATGPHLARMWELRSNLSTYDAAYVAVAEAHDVTLVTADVRIVKAGVSRCPVQMINATDSV